MNALQQRHPFSLMLYYIVAISMMLYTMHPLIIAAALCGSMLHVALLTSFQQTMRDIFYYGVYAVLITLLYSTFSHNGVTPLFFYNDNAVTKEAIAYGAMLSACFLTAIFFIKMMLLTLQTNHFLYMLTAIHPQLAIIVVLSFRFIPYVHNTWQQHYITQKGGYYFNLESRMDRLHRLLVLLLHVFMRTVEDVLAKPETLTQKGYAKKRTQFQRFLWTKLDAACVIMIVVCAVLLLITWTPYTFYPALATLTLPPTALCAAVILYALPAVLEGKEQWSWYYAKFNM